MAAAAALAYFNTPFFTQNSRYLCQQVKTIRMELRLHAFDLPLAHAFTITHQAARTVQPSLVAELRDSSGLSGFGEATATVYYGISREGMIQKLEQLRDIIENTPLQQPEQYWEALRPYLSDSPFVQCIIDEAANDLWARRQGKRLGLLWNPPATSLPATSYTIGLADIPEMIAKMQERPWPVYKIKLGTSDDLSIVRALRAHTKAAFRVDANTAWTAAQAVELSGPLRALGVEFIEQPLPPEDTDGQAYVYRHSQLPVIADESCHTEQDVERCASLFHGINIKLMKCGGLTPARRMIADARRRGLRVMVGCMTESSVGISAIAQLLPWLDYVDMDGALLLANDPAEGVCIDEQGRVHFPDAPGTGVRLK